MASKASHHGVLYGIAAYGLWGLIPLYFKAVANVDPPEVLAHRALWSFVLLAVLVRLMGEPILAVAGAPTIESVGATLVPMIVRTVVPVPSDASVTDSVTA